MLAVFPVEALSNHITHPLGTGPVVTALRNLYIILRWICAHKEVSIGMCKGPVAATACWPVTGQV